MSRQIGNQDKAPRRSLRNTVLLALGGVATFVNVGLFVHSVELISDYSDQLRAAQGDGFRYFLQMVDADNNSDDVGQSRYSALLEQADRREQASRHNIDNQANVAGLQAVGALAGMAGVVATLYIGAPRRRRDETTVFVGEGEVGHVDAPQTTAESTPSCVLDLFTIWANQEDAVPVDVIPPA